MNTYVIPVYWQTYGTYLIEAENLSDAIDKAAEWDRPLPDDGEYVDDSISVDEDGLGIVNDNLTDEDIRRATR